MVIFKQRKQCSKSLCLLIQGDAFFFIYFFIRVQIRIFINLATNVNVTYVGNLYLKNLLRDFSIKMINQSLFNFYITTQVFCCIGYQCNTHTKIISFLNIKTICLNKTVII